MKLKCGKTYLFTHSTRGTFLGRVTGQGNNKTFLVYVGAKPDEVIELNELVPGTYISITTAKISGAVEQLQASTPFDMEFNGKTPELEDAQNIAIQNPKEFYAPTPEELDAIDETSHVKVCCAGERFWCRVNKVEGDVLIGVIDNNLVYTPKHGLQFDDDIQLRKSNVYAIETLTGF